MSMADTLLSAVDDKSEVGKLLNSLLANPFQLQALRLVLGMQVGGQARLWIPSVFCVWGG